MKLSVRKKLYAGFGSILAVLVTLVSIVWIEVIGAHKSADEIRMDDVPGTVTYLVLIDEAGDVYRDALGAIIKLIMRLMTTARIRMNLLKPSRKQSVWKAEDQKIIVVLSELKISWNVSLKSLKRHLCLRSMMNLSY